MRITGSVQHVADRVATERIERALFTLYRASPADESGAFEALESSVGRRFPLLSYLFFLKDETAFLPVRQRFFGQAFAMIGLEPAPNLTCSWQNYLDFLAAVEEVREALGAWLNLEHPTLLEAHSWLWTIQTSEENFLRAREERERRARRAIARPGARSEARQSSGAR